MWANSLPFAVVRSDMRKFRKTFVQQGVRFFEGDRLIALCRACHAQTDSPFCQGRLVITPLGNGQFRCETVRGSKSSLR